MYAHPRLVKIELDGLPGLVEEIISYFINCTGLTVFAYIFSIVEPVVSRASS